MKQELVDVAWALLGIVWMIFKFVATTALALILLFGLVYLVSPAERRVRLRAGWMRVALKIGHFNSNVLLGLFYWIVITPYGIVMRLFADPMRMKTRHTWINRSTRDLTLRDARKQS